MEGIVIFAAAMLSYAFGYFGAAALFWLYDKWKARKLPKPLTESEIEANNQAFIESFTK